MQHEIQFIGQSGAFLDAVERASRAASMNRPVLVIGERGTGKELIAERLHRLSSRWDEPLVTMNCAALPETLIEAELFGHEAGAFTGATKSRAGRFEEADRGTLFLDELGTLSMGAQERLLRAVEYGEITRIGASRPIRVDVRIVAATNDDLPALAAAGEFRADLLDRLSFEVITLPPLRVREGDIGVLAEYFGRRMAAELEWDRWPGFADHVMDALEDHLWPGNVRELRNVVERAVYRGPMQKRRLRTCNSIRSTARGGRNRRSIAARQPRHFPMARRIRPPSRQMPMRLTTCAQRLMHTNARSCNMRWASIAGTSARPRGRLT
jgi:psp operon transcriptional activator